MIIENHENNGSAGCAFLHSFHSHFRVWTWKQATTGHSGIFRVSLELHGCLLEASWGHLGVLLGAIWGLKMSIFTQVLQAFPLLDAFGDAQLQALAIHAS